MFAMFSISLSMSFAVALIFSASTIASRARRVRILFSASGFICPIKASTVMPVICMYWSKERPWLDNLPANSWIICCVCSSTIGSGSSTVIFSTTFSTTSFSFSLFASSFLRSVKFFLTLALYSLSVSNSETSLANSSSSFGSSFFLISFTVTLKRAGLPFKEASWYSSGKVTFTSTSSPAFLPTNWSSNVSINEWLPITKE